jgi:hypothetical protein
VTHIRWIFLFRGFMLFTKSTKTCVQRIIMNHIIYIYAFWYCYICLSTSIPQHTTPNDLKYKKGRYLILCALYGITVNGWEGYFCAHCLHPVSYVPSVTSVSGSYILDCHFGFLYRLFTIYSLSCVLCTQCCQCLRIVHSWLSLRFSLLFIYYLQSILCLVYPMSPDRTFLIARSVFTLKFNDYQLYHDCRC